MNTVHAHNNRYKNGEYKPSYSIAIVKDKAMSIEPSQKQVQYRDNLYKFLLEKGIVMDRFKLARTRQGVRSNIYALISLLKKNGLDVEFFGRGAEDGK